MPALFSAADVTQAYGLSLAPVAAGIQRGAQQQYINQQLEQQRENKRIAEQDKSVNMLGRMYGGVNLATGTGADPLAAAELKAVQDELVGYLKTYKGSNLYVDAYEQAAPRVAAIAARQDAAAKLKTNVDATLTEYGKTHGFYDMPRLRADVLRSAIFNEDGTVRPVIDPGQDYLSPVLTDPSKAARYVDPALARKSLTDALNAQDPEEKVEAFVMRMGGGEYPQEVRYSARPFQQLDEARRAVVLAQDRDVPVAALRADDFAMLTQRPEFPFLAQSALQNIERQTASNPNSEYAKKWATLNESQKLQAAGYSVLDGLGSLKGTKVDAAKTPAAFNEYQQQQRFYASEARADRREASSAARTAAAINAANKPSKAWDTSFGALVRTMAAPQGTQQRAAAQAALGNASSVPLENVNPKDAITAMARGGVAAAMGGKRAAGKSMAPTISLNSLAKGKNYFIDPKTGTPVRAHLFAPAKEGTPALIYQAMTKSATTGEWAPTQDYRSVFGENAYNELSVLSNQFEGIDAADFQTLFAPVLYNTFSQK